MIIEDQVVISEDEDSTIEDEQKQVKTKDPSFLG